jgi:hypothetical protein
VTGELPVLSANEVLEAFHDAVARSMARVGQVSIKEEVAPAPSVRQLRIDARLLGGYRETKAALATFLGDRPTAVADQLTWSASPSGEIELSTGVVILVREPPAAMAVPHAK